MLKLEIEYINPKKLTNYKKNNKKHNDNLEVIKESLSKFGFLSPLIVDQNYVLIAGHGRTKAAIELGMTEVPITKANLTPDQAKEFRILDNFTQALGQISDAMVLKELSGMTNLSSGYLKEFAHIAQELETLELNVIKQD